MNKVNNNPIEWYRYGNSYYETIMVILRDISANGNLVRSNSILPLLHLYFHYIEIMLKAILIKNGYSFKLDHNLNKLYSLVLPILKETVKRDNADMKVYNPSSVGDIELLKNIIEVLGKFHFNHDFKYPNFEFNILEDKVRLETQEFTDSTIKIHNLLDYSFEDPFQFFRNQPIQPQ